MWWLVIADVEGDLRRFDFQLKAIERKEQSLQRLRTAFANGGPEDAAEFLDDVVKGANFGWNQMSPNRATFDGLLDSGRLANALNKLVKTVQRSPLEAHLIAEINLARFIRGITEYLRTQGSDLLVGLKDYQNKIA
jgi:hypothetical protein